jgi:hypothetical protein
MENSNIKYYYSKKEQTFYVSDININLAKDVIEITAEQHNKLLNAINSGCIIFDDLTYSLPRPSQFHYWIDGEWVENTEEKNKHIVSDNTNRKNNLLIDANEKIAILQDIIDLDMQESNEDEQLKAWKKYRILLTRIDVNDIKVKFPKTPE